MMHIALMYHDVWKDTQQESGFTNGSAFQYKIPVAEFEEHVKAVDFYCKKHPDCQVEFTFDDGGISFLTTVAPVLEKYNKRGVFFIATKYIGTEGFLSMEQVTELAKRGHIIGSHSHSHKELNRLERSEIETEWQTSVKIIGLCLKQAGLSQDNITASIPNGESNKTVVDEAYKAGIKQLYTSTPTVKRKRKKNMEITGRYVVYNGMDTNSVLDIIGSRKTRCILCAKRAAIQTVKILLGSKYNKIKTKILNLR